MNKDLLQKLNFSNIWSYIKSGKTIRYDISKESSSSKQLIEMIIPETQGRTRLVFAYLIYIKGVHVSRSGKSMFCEVGCDYNIFTPGKNLHKIKAYLTFKNGELVITVKNKVVCKITDKCEYTLDD